MKANAIRAAMVQPPIDFVAMERRAAQFRRQVEEVEVNDVTTYLSLASLLVTVKAISKNVFLEFDPWVKKAHSAHKECLAARDRYLDVFLEAEKLAKQKLALFCAESGEVPECADVIVSEIWKFEIEDPSKLPAELLMPDVTKIKALVKALRGEAGRAIPGVRVWSENQMAVKGSDI